MPGRKRRPLSPPPPEGYSYDWVNADVVLNRMSVHSGRLALQGGMRYRALVVPDYVNQITLPVLRKLRELVSSGATLIATRPTGSPSLADRGKDAEFLSIASELWGSIDGDRIKEHASGKGKVYWGEALGQALAGGGVSPDFEYNRPKADSMLSWIHRRSGDTHLYFVANQKERAEDFLICLRVDGMEAELWHPDTGEVEPAAYEITGGRTAVPLHLDPHGSVFVVFRRPATERSRSQTLPSVSELSTIAGPWELHFAPGRGAPQKITMDSLVSWTQREEEGVKYFSGTASYIKEIEAPAAWFKPGAKIVLNLGKVRELAEVSVNGKSAGTVLWKPPFQDDVTPLLKTGMNRLEISVVNLWPNRIIGDQQPAAARKYSWLNANYKPFNHDSSLMESGFLGPVQLVQESR